MGDRDESQIYRDLMRFKPDHLSPNAWAVQAGVSRAVWADMRRHGNPSRRTLQKLLQVAGSSLAEFEALRLGDERPAVSIEPARLGELGSGWRGPTPPPLPLIASSVGGHWLDTGAELTEIRRDAIIDRLPRPASLAGDPDAYAITIVGDSMWPRFRPGRRVAVSPCAPVAIGDDVLLRVQADARGGEAVLIKELVKRAAAAIELRQFNPKLSIEVATVDVEAVHKVVGELI